MVRDITKAKRDGNLQKETHGGQGVASQPLEAEALDDGRRVRVEGPLRAVVGERDDDVDPEAPVAKLTSKSAYVRIKREEGGGRGVCLQPF